MMGTLDILDRLVAFPSVTGGPNGEIAGWIGDYLSGLGFHLHALPSHDGAKTGLIARIGPRGPGGALLSAHMDVVPVAGQAWTRDPFRLTEESGRLYGRGTTDMKGFLACALHAAAKAAETQLARPFMLALSYDEEIGCRGIAGMIDHVLPVLGRPGFCIVGEPTSMRLALGHKGKIALGADCRGEAGHSANAPNHLNALHLASRFVLALEAEQARLADEGARDEAYDVPYATVHAGRMSGGIALNVVPDRASVEFEIRALTAGEGRDVLGRIREAAAEICRRSGKAAAAIAITETNAYPGLATPPEAEVVRTVAALLPEGAARIKVAYGTEAGFFDRIGIPTLVCGPGSMAQGHQPDEFIERSELERCDRMLRNLLRHLSA
jgi:acetylornithine deacetylase